MRPRGIMLELTAQRLREVMAAPLVVQGGPPPLPTAWERALARRDLPRAPSAAVVAPREPARSTRDASGLYALELSAIDRGR